jgi:CARDB
VRVAALTALSVIALAGVPAGAQTPVLKLPVRAKLADCHRGPAPTDRYAVFVGQMPALQGTQHMWMRFDLYERPRGTGPWLHVVDVPTFGVWEKSKAGKPGFIYTKRVDQLQAPAAYRAVVHFRWYDAAGKLQRHERRVSSTCSQPDPRPDLTVGRVTATDAGSGNLRYVVRVRNEGRSDAGAFDTVLTVNGKAQPAVNVAGVAVGSVARVVVVAPRCAPGSDVRVAVDPSDVVDEILERNNIVSRPCPVV